MDDIRDLINRTLSEGLPSSIEAVGGQIGHANYDVHVKSKEWDAVREQLYGSSGTGLLSGLNTMVKGVFDEVEKGWGLCKAAEEPLKALPTLLEKLKIPLAPHEVISTLQNAWKSLDAAEKALKGAQEGPAPMKVTSSSTLATPSSNPSPSLATLAHHVSLATEPSYATLRTYLSSIISEFDKHAWTRFLLENAYEQRRLDDLHLNRKILSLFTEGNCELYAIHQKWRNNMDKQYYFALDARPYEERVVSNAYRRIWKSYIPRIHALPAAEITPTSEVKVPTGIARTLANYDEQAVVQAIGSVMLKVLLDCEKNGEPAPKWNTNELHHNFDNFIAGQQAIVKALSMESGPWVQAEKLGERARAAYALREYLDVTLDYMRQLGELVDKFKADVIGSLAKDIPGLQLDLQDLHASLYFGDTEDQGEAVEQLKVSIEKWTSTLQTLERTTYKQFPSILPYNRIHYGQISNKIPSHSPSHPIVDRTRVLISLAALDASNNHQLATKAEINDAGDPKISLWDNCEMYTATGQFLSLPSSGTFEFGSLTTDGHNLLAERNMSKALEVDFSVKFSKTQFASVPNVVVWINGISCSNTSNYRMSVEAINISPTGFTLRAMTWWDTKLTWLGMGWFAYPNDAVGICSGREYTTKHGCHTDQDWAPYTDIRFDPDKFAGRPKVFVGIRSLDLGNRQNARFRGSIGNVTKNGMKVIGNAWWDTQNHRSGVSYIAFDDRFFQ